MLVAPLALLFIPNGNLDFSCVLTHVNCLWENKLNLDTNVCSYVSRWIWVGNVSQTLLYCQDWPHGPLSSDLALFRVLVHLEVDDSSNDEVILDLVWRQIVIAGPEGSHNDLATGLLLRQLSNMIIEDNVVTVLIFTGNVRPDAKQDVTLGTHSVQNVLASLVTLG